MARRNAAAVTMQTMWRGHLARRTAAALCAEEVTGPDLFARSSSCAGYLRGGISTGISQRTVFAMASQGIGLSLMVSMTSADGAP